MNIHSFRPSHNQTVSYFYHCAILFLSSIHLSTECQEETQIYLECLSITLSWDDASMSFVSSVGVLLVDNMWLSSFRFVGEGRPSLEFCLLPILRLPFRGTDTIDGLEVMGGFQEDTRFVSKPLPSLSQFLVVDERSTVWSVNMFLLLASEAVVVEKLLSSNCRSLSFLEAIVWTGILVIGAPQMHSGMQ